MTRPSMVRADTLDLQDQDSPSAQDHSRNQGQNVDFSDNLLASHQASEIRHVTEERHDEERNLQQAWNASGESINTNGVNGSQSTAEDGQSIHTESDAASDDDMMDRISSSPSIDDVAQWNLLQPNLVIAQTPNRNNTMDSVDDTNTDGSTRSSDYVTTDDDFSDASSDWSGPDTPVTNFFDRFIKGPIPNRSGVDSNALDEDDDIFTSARMNDNLSDEEHPPLPSIAEHDMHGSPWLRNSFSSHRRKTWNPSLSSPEESPTTKSSTRHRTLHCRDFDMLTSTPDLDFASIRTQSSASFETIDTRASKSPSTDQQPYSHPSQALKIDFSGCWLLRADGCFFRDLHSDECLQDIEDIDFDFVYALHTFVATVEGQANATKGDTMVLLDDSNSYWWLVRVVKDSSIGYLPAEHIETPTERLARLNKHRNVDLSAAMLGDNAERSKNPLKKAMKRRQTKTVQFAAPTYVEASDYDWSDEDEDEVPEMRFGTNAAGGNSPQQQQTTTVDTIQSSAGDNITQQTATVRDSPQQQSTEAPLSPKILEKDEAAALTKSRKGTTRNADSFLKDDTAETRKFTLTPNLLRDDSNGGSKSTIRSETSGTRIESPDPFAPDPKEDKRKKEKKQGMLSGLFKSKKKEKEKEKAKKKEFVSENDVERVSLDTARHSTASLPATDPVAKGREVMERKTSQKGRKLQKHSPGATPTSTAPTTPIEGPTRDPMSQQQQQSAAYMAELEGSQVAYEAPTGLEDEIPIAPPPSTTKPKPKSHRVKPARQRQALDDFDEQEEDEARASGSLDSDDIRNGSFMHGTEAVHIPMRPGDYDSSEDEDKGNDTAEEGKDGSSTPPSIIEANEPPKKEALQAAKTTTVTSDDAKTDDDPTPVPSKSQSPHPPVESTSTIPPPTRAAPTGGDDSSLDPQRQNSKSSTGSSRANMSPSPASTNATTWSDAGLRAWLDGDNDVRDMLTIIYDTSNVKPVSNDHPLMKDLFKDERDSLNKMSAELDGLLHGLLQRKGTLQASV
ncbi:putative tip elongation aberrant protein Tea4 [Elsinoe fawcettii]|nr:putative tip elongation aberrant protein Tea4 [Elsinoe fawcettii]